MKRRQDRRKKYNIFAHESFDAALKPEAMSSDESGDDGTPNELVVRGFPWRSTRLRNFYATLDADDATAEVVQINDTLMSRPRRVVPRKERTDGPPKDGAELPPKGVARWMVSRRWIIEQLRTNPQAAELLTGLIMDFPDFNWEAFLDLGEESEDEPGPEPMPETVLAQYPVPTYHQPTYHNSTHGISYSLAHAMTPMSQQ